MIRRGLAPQSYLAQAQPPAGKTIDEPDCSVAKLGASMPFGDQADYEVRADRFPCASYREFLAYDGKRRRIKLGLGKPSPAKKRVALFLESEPPRGRLRFAQRSAPI
jgi:hypothetical protein